MYAIKNTVWRLFSHELPLKPYMYLNISITVSSSSCLGKVVPTFHKMNLSVDR